jgi:hypothetical protein
VKINNAIYGWRSGGSNINDVPPKVADVIAATELI